MNEKKVQIEDEDAVSFNLVYSLVNKKGKNGRITINDDPLFVSVPAEVFDNRCIFARTILDLPDLTF